MQSWTTELMLAASAGNLLLGAAKIAHRRLPLPVLVAVVEVEVVVAAAVDLCKCLWASSALTSAAAVAAEDARRAMDRARVDSFIGLRLCRLLRGTLPCTRRSTPSPCPLVVAAGLGAEALCRGLGLGRMQSNPPRRRGR